MSKMDMCTAKIALSSDKRTVVWRGPTNPIPFPDLELIRATHGERSVSDVTVVGEVETTMAEEVLRMRMKYGSKDMNEIFGKRPTLPLKAYSDVPRAIEDDSPFGDDKAKTKAPVKASA